MRKDMRCVRKGDPAKGEAGQAERQGHGDRPDLACGGPRADRRRVSLHACGAGEL